MDSVATALVVRNLGGATLETAPNMESLGSDTAGAPSERALLSVRARILSTWPAVLAASATVLAFRNALSRSFVLYHRDLGLLISPVIAEARRASGKAVDLLPLW